MNRKAWIEVLEERLAANFRVVSETAGAGTELLAVVKANGYGHGAEACSVALARAGALWLGVGSANEGARVRRALAEAGFGDAKILVMCGLMAEDVPLIAEHRLTPVVWTQEQVGWLSGHAGMKVHVEVDTGMARQGVRRGAELDALLDTIRAAGLELDGVMTHFASAEVAGSALTAIQQQRFEGAMAQVEERGQKPAWVHAGSTSSVDEGGTVDWLAKLAKRVEAHPMMRIGLALYGYCLPLDCAAGVSAEAHVRPRLQPVMRWKTRIMDVHDLALGETVGYNGTFTAPWPMRVGLLPIGYADGLRRELSSNNEKTGGWVMIAGKIGAILGRISMNLTTVDVTEIEGVRVGDEAILLGDGVTADDHAAIAGTIAYEILCGVREG